MSDYTPARRVRGQQMIPFIRVQNENGDLWAIPVQSITHLFQPRGSTVHMLEVQNAINAAAAAAIG